MSIVLHISNPDPGATKKNRTDVIPYPPDVIVKGYTQV